MNNPALLTQQLQTLWLDNFPMAGSMQLRVGEFNNHLLTVHAPLAPNTNIHNTAFAGSLYAIQAMTAWGLIHIEAQAANLDVSIIHAHGEIDFSKTITHDIVAQCDFTEQLNCIEELKSTGKSRFDLNVSAAGDNDPSSAASMFTGHYVVRVER